MEAFPSRRPCMRTCPRRSRQVPTVRLPRVAYARQTQSQVPRRCPCLPQQLSGVKAEPRTARIAYAPCMRFAAHCTKEHLHEPTTPTAIALQVMPRDLHPGPPLPALPLRLAYHNKSAAIIATAAVICFKLQRLRRRTSPVFVNPTHAELARAGRHTVPEFVHDYPKAPKYPNAPKRPSASC